MFLGCDMPLQLVLSSEYDDWKIASTYILIHVTDLCLNKFYFCGVAIMINLNLSSI